jgi:hypothetical protein
LILTPAEYPTTPVSTLLAEVARGRVPFDHVLIRDLIGRPQETAQAIASVSPEGWIFDITDELLDLCRHLRDAQVLPFLMKVLDDSADESLFEAFAALGAAAIDPLLAAYPEANDEIKDEILFALAALGTKDDRIEALLKSAPDGDIPLGLYQEGHTPKEFDVFADSEPEGLPVAEALNLEERLELLDSPEERLRVFAAASLYREEMSAGQQDRLFAAARQDVSVTVRAHCWEALEGTERADIIAEMMERLADSRRPDEERTGILVALATKSDEEPVHDAIIAFYEQPSTRVKALEAMWRSLDTEFTDYFRLHLEDAHIETRRIALRGVGALRVAAELGRIRKAIHDDDVREDAIFAYALAAPGKSSIAFLRSLQKKVEKEAGGLSHEDEEVLCLALDERLRSEGKEPVFMEEHMRDHHHDHGA